LRFMSLVSCPGFKSINILNYHIDKINRLADYLIKVEKACIKLSEKMQVNPLR